MRVTCVDLDDTLYMEIDYLVCFPGVFGVFRLDL